MFDTIILPLDTSPHAEAAVPYAFDEALRRDATLVLLHVVPRPESPAPSPHVQRGGPALHAPVWDARDAERAARGGYDYLERVRCRYALPAETICRVVIGEPIRRIEAEVDAWPRALVVMTTGEDADSARSPLSEVARRLLTCGKAPVLGIRHEQPVVITMPMPRHELVATH